MLWILFVIDTLLIAAAGYVINDIMDKEADVQNKPDLQFIGDHGISKKSAWIYYALLVFIGFVIAFYIAYKIEKLALLSIYPFAVICLFLYSTNFKRKPLLGNIVVSIFCAFVPAIIWYAEFDSLRVLEKIDYEQYFTTVRIFIAYILFAFFSTMVREIIKDIEDVEGDKLASYRTLPIVAGIDRANVFSLFFCVVLICSYGLWFVGSTLNQQLLLGSLVTVFLIVPTLFILKQIYSAKHRVDYSRISKRLKYLMVVSLFIFLCIPLILDII